MGGFDWCGHEGGLVGVVWTGVWSERGRIGRMCWRRRGKGRGDRSPFLFDPPHSGLRERESFYMI